MSSYKMKSLLKGLRYISQVFESEKEPEMKIGHPTNVKHVAHIGCDGPSATAPSWMNEFKSGEFANESPAKCSSESGRTRDLPKIPKSSKKSACGSPTKPKRHSSSSSNKASSSSRRSKEHISDPNEDSSSRHSSNNLSGIPKKSKRKKSKDSVGGGSSRSSRRSDMDSMSENGSVKSISHQDEQLRGF